MEHEGHAATAQKPDEREHAERPLLDQLAGLGWDIIELMGKKQAPPDTHRESFTDFVSPLVLCERRKVINWLKDNQVEESVKQLAGG